MLLIWSRQKFLSFGKELTKLESSPANAFNLDKGKILLTGEALILSLLMTTIEAFVDSVDQDQTAQNMQSDL